MNCDYREQAQDDAYDRFVGSLYRDCREEPIESFQDCGLTGLEALIPFDYGFWLRAGVEEGRQHRLYGQYGLRLPPELKAAWTPFEDRDVVGRMTLAAQGRTVNVAARNLGADPEIIEQVVERFGLEYMLATCLVDPLTSLLSAVALVRGANRPPFSEAERRLKQRAMPHLVEAYSINRLIHLMAVREADSRLDYATAACDGEALLNVASPEFAALLRLEWPTWQGPRLPPVLAPHLGETGSAAFRGQAIVIRFEPIKDLIWLRARSKVPIDDLSPRETEVARLCAAGESNKTIGRRLRVSPFTVRNQLAAIYSKLGVGTRTELAAWLSELA